MIDARQHIIGKLVGYDYETITVAATAIGLTASKLTATPKAKTVFITAESGVMRYRYDGTDPTSTVGHILRPNSTMTIEGSINLSQLKFIRTGTTSGKLQVTYAK